MLVQRPMPVLPLEATTMWETKFSVPPTLFGFRVVPIFRTSKSKGEAVGAVPSSLPRFILNCVCPPSEELPLLTLYRATHKGSVFSLLSCAPVPCFCPPEKDKKLP